VALDASGAVILSLTLFIGSGFVETAYHNYILYPGEKADEGYIMPLRWQDIVAELSIACVLIGYFFFRPTFCAHGLPQT
jgi:hypothetical protein